MSRRTITVAALAALTTLAGALPGLPRQAAAASCSGWTSSATPPSSIRVFRHATGAVEVVNFKAYTKNVLSREWIASWTTESLRSGALAVKHYAWYQVLHWRGGTNSAGACFDVRDDTQDQVYDPSRPTYTPAVAAVNATWSTRVLKNGAIFPTYYNAGASGEACGANANGWKMFQWGTEACGLAGRTAAQIMVAYYYPGVTVSGAPPPTSSPTPTPSPRPTASPRPTPTPTATPAPSSPSATPRSSATPSPAPTPPPTPVPTPTPAPSIPTATPPPSQTLPGGGQSGIVNAPAPPAPPPADPKPVVVRPAHIRRERVAPPATLEARVLDWRVLGWADLDAARPLWPAFRLVGMQAPPGSAAPRLTPFAVLWRSALEDLAQGLMRRLAANRAIGLAGVARFRAR